MNDQSEYSSLFGDKLPGDLKYLQRIGGGRNSQVYKLDCSDGRHYLAKVYYRHDEDSRDRLAAEFDGLTFLWQSGVRAVPEPLSADPIPGFAIYEYIHGQAINSSNVTTSDIDRAVDFLITLSRLTDHPGAAGLQPASEACFSVKAIVENVQQRIKRLSSLPDQGSLEVELQRFLANEMGPFFAHVKEWSRARLLELGLELDWELPIAERTLSPSDFGFHNALRRSDGNLVFLDFEYFGWDDPAKMIADFVLHPAMNLPLKFKRRYVRGLLAHFTNIGALSVRLSAVYPLFGLKWCLILLNEFVPVDRARRDFAEIESVERGERLAQQLTKARKMLAEVMQSYERAFNFN
ncbi:MAG: phosphotransferase [Planctomycetota bacterium]|jgi:hypothetical protein